MAIREALNSHPKPVIGAVSGMLIVVAAFGLYAARTPQMNLPTQGYFSDDDGRTFFVDSVMKTAPFDRGGRQAVAAHVFQCGNGAPFVGYVERAVSTEAKAIVEKDRAEVAKAILERPTSGPDGELLNRIKQNLEVKRPGGRSWVNANSSNAIEIYKVACPDGGLSTEVTP